MFMPPVHEMDLIIEAIKLTDPKVLGFIISMKDYAPSYEKVRDLNRKLQKYAKKRIYLKLQFLTFD